MQQDPTNQPDNRFYRLHVFFGSLHAFYSCFFIIKIIINV